VRLLWAEIAKLNRPLTWGVAAAAALFMVLLAAGGAHNAALEARGDRNLPSCAALGIPAGPRCVQVRTAERARLNQALAEPRHVAAQLSPAEAGAEAAGLVASLPGALALALLAGAHVGGEWSGRTMKNLLIQRGRRWQVLGAKVVSLWLAGAGLIGVGWAALAAAGPALTRLNHLPNAHVPASHTLSLAGSQSARALLVLAGFAVIGLLAGVVTRSTIGTTAATVGVVIATLAVASLPGAGRWTPATWIQGWMGFPVGQASITSLPTNFWSRFITSGGAAPSHLLGLAGLAGLITAGMVAAEWAFRRADISG
jgi:ABC-type transport system involved in multi-copper enzyme maturation permease subunit